jgi:hypothetical protein
MVGKVVLGRVFSEYFGLPCQSSFHQIHHNNHPGQATIGQSVAAVPSGPSWTPPSTKRIKKITLTEVSGYYHQPQKMISGIVRYLAIGHYRLIPIRNLLAIQSHVCSSFDSEYAGEETLLK